MPFILRSVTKSGASAALLRRIEDLLAAGLASEDEKTREKAYRVFASIIGDYNSSNGLTEG